MKKNYFIFRIQLAFALVFASSTCSFSQNPYWRLGGNNNAGDIITAANNFLGSQGGAGGVDVGINFMTFGTNRMFINQNASSGAFGGCVGIGTGFLPNSVYEPITRLHIGYPDNLYTANGWRPWMKEGLFVHKGTDIVYLGLMDTSLSDRQDAILAWGDNTSDLGLVHGPDFLRIIFNERSAGTWANGYYGREVMRFVPDSRIGMGVGFNASILPGAHVDIVDGGQTPAGLIPQLALTYTLNANPLNAVRTDFQTFSSGDLAISPQNAATEKNAGIAAIGIFSTATPPVRKLEVLKDAIEPQFRISRSYNSSVADFQVTNAGHLIITPMQTNVGRRTGIGFFTQVNPPQQKLDVIDNATQMR